LTENGEVLSGCTSAVTTTTVQARIGHGKIFAAPLPWLLNATSLPETTAPAPLRDNASGVRVTRTITYILRCTQDRLYTANGLRIAQSVDTCAWD
jgi:hypothetical protein